MEQEKDRDTLFQNTPACPDKFEFNEEVALIFDDMLTRSVPFYLEQQSLIRDITKKFYQPGTHIIDLGCSTATTMINIGRAIKNVSSIVGYDNSQSMLKIAQENLIKADLHAVSELRYADFNESIEAFELTNASVVVLCWTLQFVDPLKRDALIRKIYNSLKEGGVLIVTEKTLPNDSNMNRLFIDFYHEFKYLNGYSEEEILKKREALEDVLIPFHLDENLELFRRNGFQIVETFFQWYNFAGFLCIKNENGSLTEVY